MNASNALIASVQLVIERHGQRPCVLVGKDCSVCELSSAYQAYMDVVRPTGWKVPVDVQQRVQLLVDRIAIEWNLTDKQRDLFGVLTDQILAGKHGYDYVNNPRHYNAHPSGVEAWDLCDLLGFNLGTAVKYLFRIGHKPNEDEREAIKKSIVYFKRTLEKSTFLGGESLNTMRHEIHSRMHKVMVADPHSLLGKCLHALLDTKHTVYRTRLQRCIDILTDALKGEAK